MRLFIYEHITCGGDSTPALEPLRAEGEAMLSAAMSSFADVDGVKPFTIAGEANDGAFEKALNYCHAALIIAPETGGVLEKLTIAVEKAGKLNIGSAPDAIQQTGDKLAFAQLMAKLNLPHPETYSVNRYFDKSVCDRGKWIIKPIDGAGAIDMTIIEGGMKNIAITWDGAFIAQRYVEGEAMSLSVVSSGGRAKILSVNRQTFGANMKYLGGETLDMEPSARLIEIVKTMAGALPGLKGYWGMDFVMTKDGPVVIEVNPRLTTSYCAVALAVEPNPAGIIVAAASGTVLPEVTRRRKSTFTVDGKVTLI